MAVEVHCRSRLAALRALGKGIVNSSGWGLNAPIPSVDEREPSRLMMSWRPGAETPKITAVLPGPAALATAR
ncbi:MAG: hypothetical protein Q6365_001840 [Candidatus Sigynarchaeota archaeon]